jgi:hypothetical protein
LSFDDIFGLLIIVIFIGLPLLNRLRGAPPPGGRPPGAPGPGRPVDPRTGAPGRPGPATGGPAATTTRERDDDRRAEQDPMDELSRRLEEARRRVRDAMGEVGEPQRDRPLVTEPSRGQTIMSAGIPSGTAGGSPRPPTTSPLTPPPASVRRVSTPTPPAKVKRTGTGRRPPGFAKPTPALEVERPGTGRGAAGSPRERSQRDRAHRDAVALMAMDGASVRKGLLWHMILGEPAAFGRGRLRSPRPSR